MNEKRYVWGTGPEKKPKPPTPHHVALTDFKGLGYTQQQAIDLVGAARQLAAASGLTQDDAERALFQALREFHPRAQRLSWPAPNRSGKNWV